MFFWWICGGESGFPVLFLRHLSSSLGSPLKAAFSWATFGSQKTFLYPSPWQTLECRPIPTWPFVLTLQMSRFQSLPPVTGLGDFSGIDFHWLPRLGRCISGSHGSLWSISHYSWSGRECFHSKVGCSQHIHTFLQGNPFPGLFTLNTLIPSPLTLWYSWSIYQDKSFKTLLL